MDGIHGHQRSQYQYPYGPASLALVNRHNAWRKGHGHFKQLPKMSEASKGCVNGQTGLRGDRQRQPPVDSLTITQRSPTRAISSVLRLDTLSVSAL